MDVIVKSLTPPPVAIDLRSFITAKSTELALNLKTENIDKILRVLLAAEVEVDVEVEVEVESKESFTGLTIDELNDVMSSCQPPLPIGLKGSLRAIYSSIK